jgi:hypothetical protein
MPLTFDDRGLLPPGIHDATLDEIDKHFGRFQKSDRRISLFMKLKAYIREVKSTGWTCEIIVDGSFVMRMVDEPNDIDLILVLPNDWDVTRDLKPFEYNVVDKRFTKKEYRIEVFAVPASSKEDADAHALFEKVRLEWCRLFGWPENSKKGNVRIIA